MVCTTPPSSPADSHLRQLVYCTIFLGRTFLVDCTSLTYIKITCHSKRGHFQKDPMCRFHTKLSRLKAERMISSKLYFRPHTTSGTPERKLGACPWVAICPSSTSLDLTRLSHQSTD